LIPRHVEIVDSDSDSDSDSGAGAAAGPSLVVAD
jgi:hypothetical protein